MPAGEVRRYTLFPQWLNSFNKPARGIRLNRTHQLAQGLALDWLLNELSGIRIYSTVKPSSPPSTSFFDTGLFGSATAPVWDGKGLGFASASVALNPARVPVTPYPITIAAAVEVGAVANSGAFVQDGGADIIGIGLFSSNIEYILLGGGGATQVDVTGGAASVGLRAQVLGRSLSATAHACYVDGVQRSTSASSPGTLTLTGCHLGNAAGANNWAGWIYWARIWSRAFSDDEISWLAQEPFDMYEPLFYQRFFFLKQLASGSVFPQPTADSIAFTETFTRQVGKAVQEALGLTETLTRQAQKVILETVGLTETLNRLVNHPLAETVSLTENLGVLKVSLVGIPETVALSEQATRLVAKGVPAETVSLVETLARQTNRSMAETVSLTENLQAIKGIFRDLADTVSLTENLSVVVKKAADLAESVGLAEQLARQTSRTVAETLGLTENLAATKVSVENIAETVALSETVNRLMARVLEENVSLTEAQQRQARKTLAETVAFTESLVAGIIHSKQIAETVALTEAEQRQIGKAVQETLGLTETRFVRIAKSIGEAISFTEVLDRLFIPSIPALAQVGYASFRRLTGFVALEAFGAASPSRILGWFARDQVSGYAGRTQLLGFVSPEGPR